MDVTVMLCLPNFKKKEEKREKDEEGCTVPAYL